MKRWVWTLCLVGCVVTTGEDTTLVDGTDYSVLPCDTPEIAHDGIDPLRWSRPTGRRRRWLRRRLCRGRGRRPERVRSPWSRGPAVRRRGQRCAGNDDFDADGDGSHVDDDCDDGDAEVPRRKEIWYDGVDQACDGGDT